MFKINVINDSAQVYTPYNGDFVRRIKNIGGAKWNRDHNCWIIPASAVDACREIMRNVYGRCDIADGGKTVKLRLRFTQSLSKTCGDVTLLGKTLCHAYSRDSGGCPGDDVFYITGAPQSGGSAKYWESVVPSGSTIVLHDVSVDLYKRFIPEAIPGLTVEQIEDIPNKEKLTKEREKLLERLNEIDKLLESM